MSVFSNIAHKIKHSFDDDAKPRPHIVKEKEMHHNKSQKAVDKTSEDSFPASDPPGNY